MQENMKEYLTEKEAREKRLEVYTEKIQEKVLSRSSETIRQLVEERHRQKMTQQEIADITGGTLGVRPQCGQLKPRMLKIQRFWAYILDFLYKYLDISS